jgi:hypothetical protein
MKKYNIVQSWWFSSAQSCIGVVEIENSVGEHKYYIGTGGGFNKENDEEFIAAFGTPFDPKIFEVKNVEHN